MRKWILACTAMLIVFSVTACSFPFLQEDETTITTEGRTYVITTRNVEGLQKMTDCISWEENAVCALDHLGSRDNYKDTLTKRYAGRYADVDEKAFIGMQTIDLGGSDAYLVIPRFNHETINVFTVAIDSEQKTHLLAQSQTLEDAFILLCNTTDDPNAMLSITLVGGSTMRHVLQRDAQTGKLALKGGLQMAVGA